MSLHIVIPWREELDQIEARFEAATTIEEAERIDAEWFSTDPGLRAAWLANEGRALGMNVADYRRGPELVPEH
jgi:hypothetical protein